MRIKQVSLKCVTSAVVKNVTEADIKYFNELLWLEDSDKSYIEPDRWTISVARIITNEAKL